jgi:hypothetical protein
MIRRKFFVAFVGALDVFCGDEVSMCSAGTKSVHSKNSV